MATDVAAGSGSENVELAIQVQSFADKFEPFKQPAGCDLSEAQLRDQIAQLDDLRSEVNAWGRDFLQRFGSIDGLTATFPLEVAIENAIDERFEIIIG